MKTLAWDGFLGELYQTLKKKIIEQILSTLFQKIEAVEIFPNSFYEAELLS